MAALNLNDLQHLAAAYLQNNPANLIPPHMAENQEDIGIPIYDAPLMAVAAADDSLFKTLQHQSVVGSHHFLPQDWLAEAAGVISFFLPYSKALQKTNARHKALPSQPWLYGRIEGQALLLQLCQYLQTNLQDHGEQALVPAADSRFFAVNAHHHSYPQLSFTSNWSERHIAYIAGLGTFGLSKGLITLKGTAGRFGSIVTGLVLPPTPRPYTTTEEYCLHCGACIRKCPVHAITLQQGKDHVPCSQYLNQMQLQYAPRYGCSKCQIQVPCSQQKPHRPEK